MRNTSVLVCLAFIAAPLTHVSVVIFCSRASVVLPGATVLFTKKSSEKIEILGNSVGKKTSFRLYRVTQRSVVSKFDAYHFAATKIRLATSSVPVRYAHGFVDGVQDFHAWSPYTLS